MKIAYVSCHNYNKYSEGYIDEEALLLQFLLKKGLNIERREWDDTLADWSGYDFAILKSPWDYHERINEFQRWLDTLNALGVPLLNPVDLVRWNSDKHYLKDIACAQMPVIPSLFLQKQSQPDIESLFNHLNVEKIIIKPCVSAGAKNVFSLTRAQVLGKQAAIYQLLRHESYLVQPFVEEIKDGELSLLFFNGSFSHSVLKVPGEDDFRVQHYYGGHIKPHEASDTIIRSAAEYVERFAPGSLYARVDGIISGNRFMLMELELIEPYLYLESFPGAYENYYRALMHLSVPLTSSSSRQ